MKKIIIATNNNNKKNEIIDILSDIHFSCEILNINGLPDVDETGDTYKENAELKTNSVFEYIKKANIKADAIIGDDSGLEIKELNNEPGVYTARYAFINGHGKHHSTTDNIKYIYDIIKSDKTEAKYVCYIDILDIKNNIHIGSFGKLDGFIIKRNIKYNKNYFDYDPFFQLQDGRILSDVLKKEKNKISHRYNAITSSLYIKKG